MFPRLCAERRLLSLHRFISFIYLRNSLGIHQFVQQLFGLPPRKEAKGKKEQRQREKSARSFPIGKLNITLTSIKFVVDAIRRLGALPRVYVW